MLRSQKRCASRPSSSGSTRSDLSLSPVALKNSRSSSQPMSSETRLCSNPSIISRSSGTESGEAIMMFQARSWLFGLAISSAAVLLPLSDALAQGNYPNRAIRIVVGFAPGGSNDILARLLGDKLSKSLGQPAVIENKPGAGGALAATFVKGQPADGYTLLVGASGAMVVGPAIGAPASYDTLADFEPVSVLGTFPLVLSVNAESPHKTLKDFIAWSKANPSASNYGSASPTFTLAAELLKLRTSAQMTRVSY